MGCNCGFGSPGSGGGGGPALANPTGTVGLAVVNGVAVTAMRSDGAPPLSQAIVPTWSGAHTFQQLAGVGSRMVVTDAAGLLSAAALPSAPPVGANPTGTIGLAVVNGAAATFLRSDGAPALSQAIAPTWTGAHVFTLQTISTKNTAGIGGADASFLASAAIPSYAWRGTGGAANEQYWAAISNGTTWSLRAVNDANNAAGAVMDVVRALNVISSITFGGKVVVPEFVASARTSKQKIALAIAAGLIAVDPSLGDILTIDMSANATLSNPSALPASGFFQVFTLIARQTAGGSHTLAYGTQYRFPGGVAPVLSTVANTFDYLAFAWNETDTKWDFVGQALNFL